MNSKLLFFRLTQGKVWHVATAGSPMAVCGMPVEQGRERQPKRPPFGARPCPDCADVANQAVTAIGAAEGNRFPAYAPVATAAEAEAAYEHDLTDPDGLLSDQEFADRQQVEQAAADYTTYLEGSTRGSAGLVIAEVEGDADEFARRNPHMVVDDHPKRQRLAEAEAEYRDRMEIAEGQP